jgi:citrate/tricarballylate utilization protein
MVAVGIALSMYVVAVWSAGGVRFWLEGGRVPEPVRLRALLRAAADALNLKWLRGGGPGCYYPAARPSSLRRLFHGFVAYGFLAAFASTTIAAVYQDLLHRLPPYALTSAPVVLGSAGGVAMIVGSGGLISLKLRSDARPAGAGAAVLDYVFLLILGLAALSGMVTLALRETPMMGAILTLHLGLVAALYITAPYGKFVHALYRYLAVLRHHLEQRASKDPSETLQE